MQIGRGNRCTAVIPSVPDHIVTPGGHLFVDKRANLVARDIIDDDRQGRSIGYLVSDGG